MSCCTCDVIGMVRISSATRGSVSCGWRQVVCDWNGRYVACYLDHGRVMWFDCQVVHARVANMAVWPVSQALRAHFLECK